MAYLNFNPQTDIEKLKVLLLADQPPKNIELLNDWLFKADLPILKKYLTEWIEQCRGGAIVSSDTHHEAYMEIMKEEGVPMFAGGGAVTVGSVKDFWNSIDLTKLPDTVQVFIKEQLMDPPANFNFDDPTFLETREMIENYIATQKADDLMPTAPHVDPTDREEKEYAEIESIESDNAPERTTFITPQQEAQFDDLGRLQEIKKQAEIAQQQIKKPVYIFKHIDGSYFYSADKAAGEKMLLEIPYASENDELQVLKDEVANLEPALQYLKGADKKAVKAKIESIKAALEILGEGEEFAKGGAMEQTQMDKIALSKLTEYSSKLFDIVTDKLPAWVLAKISKAELIVASVKHDLEAKHPDLFEKGGETAQTTKMMLKHINHYSGALAKNLSKIKLEPWQSSNLFVAGDYLDSVYHYLDYQTKPKLAKGGGIEAPSNDRMYNFLKDDLAKLETAISDNDKEEVERFFSYWGQHLPKLRGISNDRMYNFLKDDLSKLEKAISEIDNEEVERFFSYWGQHLDAVKLAKGGGIEAPSNDRMYNFLKDDLAKLETAISDNDKEEVERFFSYWGQHLPKLRGISNDRMYNFLKDDLSKLEKAISEIDNEEVERFFSYWGQHLDAVKLANGGLVKVVGKKDGQLVEISELPMELEDAKRWITQQGVEKHYTQVETVPYHGNKPAHKFAEGGELGEKYKPGDFVSANRNTKKPSEQTPFIVAYWSNDAYYVLGDGSHYIKEEDLMPSTEQEFDKYYGPSVAASFKSGVKSFSNDDSLQKIEDYKGYTIWSDGGAICVTETGDSEHRFYVGVDDSKDSGARKFSDNANNVETAKAYIDWKAEVKS